MGLRIKITTEFFQAFGKYDSLNRVLNMHDKKIMVLLGQFIATILLIRSWPGNIYIVNYKIICIF